MNEPAPHCCPTARQQEFCLARHYKRRRRAHELDCVNLRPQLLAPPRSVELDLHGARDERRRRRAERRREAAARLRRRRVRLANYVEKRATVPTPAFRTEFLRATRAVVRRARRGREAKRAAEAAPDLSDAHLSQLARLTDHLALRDYTDLLDTCPRLVNVVSVSTHRTPTLRA